MHFLPVTITTPPPPPTPPLPQQPPMPELVGGNAPDYIKRQLGRTEAIEAFHAEKGKHVGFSRDIFTRMIVEDISILSPEAGEGQGKEVVRVTCALDVSSDMTNNTHHLHGGCSAYLVDMCTNIAVLAHQMYKRESTSSVSQCINTVYHSPASIGEKLRIVSTTMTLGSRTMTARTEIWNATKHRLCVSGTQIKMSPSLSPAKL
ncbi:hypothetical protein Moror_9764 [Moniliophthora roreri MCA 2997]|uniref:Thioesterase domain-containing protein n=2 Tax=Moniliophthora roreri TaxID=221103 RepID=V2X1B8_MONRO|nr:hypothetical protein Moror_9764 [Moniliophthora roreri MCA 2997]KAI3599221.1 hypothetical protein WG66_013409 [Moniliophthora roreri]